MIKRHLLSVLCISLLFIILWAGCGQGSTKPLVAALPKATLTLPAPLSGSGDVARSALSCSELTNGFAAKSPVDESALGIPDNAAAPSYFFEGRLELLGEAENGSFQLLQGELSTSDTGLSHLPELIGEFVQDGSYLIPVQRGLIITGSPYWNYILEPGRVWVENGDDGDSRASFPFTLVPTNGNSSFNGVMAFLFNDEKVSKVWYQVTQETSSSLRANFWGLLDAVYHRGTVSGADQIRKSYAQELAERTPTRPIEQLAMDYPGLEIKNITHNITPEHMTLYGVVVNGVNYIGGCRTRFGIYPYCEQMRLASFSTAKSAFVALALMRLAQKYGADVPNLLIKDYVLESSDSPGDWSKVTFNHTLDMATGNYNSAGYMVDEEGRIFQEFFGAESYTDKIRVAFDWQHSAEPGTRWNYRSSDTFIVTRAMQNYLRSKEGESADIFDFVVKEIYQPLKIGPGFFTTTRTSENNWQGQPVGSFGLWWIADDIAKLTTFLNAEGGKIAGEQVLSASVLAASLQQDAKDRGVKIDNRLMYNNAFWAQKFTKADGFACEFWVPYMAGYSGNIIALLPNGISYYYFSDNREFNWISAVQEIDKIIPMCSK